MAESSTSQGAAEQAAPAEAKPPRRRITRRKAVEDHVRSYFAALSGRDPAAMAGHWREDGVADIVPLGTLRGSNEISALFRELFAALPDLETTVTRIVTDQSRAAVEWRMSGHFTGSPFQGIEATGRPVELRGFDLIEVEDGKNVSSTAYYDGMAFARQAGLMPAQDSGAERAMKSAMNAATRVRRALAERRAGP
jgi:steroid delta-isomerase-like uncharacterized protein